MQLTEERGISKKWLLAIPLVFIIGCFIVAGLGFFMLVSFFSDEKPAEETGTFTGSMVYTISPVGEKEIPKQFIEIYKEAAAKYSVPWPLLAAEHKVETNFSSIKNMISPVGATGHLQFMPCTWVYLTISPFI